MAQGYELKRLKSIIIKMKKLNNNQEIIMKLKQSSSFAIIIFSLCHGFTANAKDSVNMADEIETPDVLLQNSGPKDKKVRYGDTDISVSPKGKKDNALVAPDLLERQVEAKDKYKEDQTISKKKKQAKEKFTKKSEKYEPGNNIETPDPLLDF